MHVGQLRYAAAQAGFIAKDGPKRTTTRVTRTGGSAAPKRGEEIFEGTDYPRTWDEFIGQRKAIVQLKAACHSAKVRGKHLDHVLLATGMHGIGKTSLAKLIAVNVDAGLIEVSGKITIKDIQPILRGMRDGDVLFIDEIHQLVSGGKANAEWLLHLLQDGVLMTAKGPEEVPDITIIGATTDVQKLPETIISRFVVRPSLEPYTLEEAADIAEGMAKKIGLGEPSYATLLDVATASNNSPREMKGLLITIRDAALSGLAPQDSSGRYDLSVPLEWLNLTRDGLDLLAQNYLCVLLLTFNGKAGVEAIASALGEPTAPRHTEKLLTQRGYVTRTATGRELTNLGIDRTIALISERGLDKEES